MAAVEDRGTDSGKKSEKTRLAPIGAILRRSVQPPYLLETESFMSRTPINTCKPSPQREEATEGHQIRELEPPGLSPFE